MTSLDFPALTPFLHLKTCGSTQDFLLSGSGEGWFLIWADRQTAGRGRRNARWSSPPGGLYYTLRYPESNLEVSPALQVMGGALCWLHTLQDLPNFSGNLSLKWPNDLLLDGRKLCGLIGEQRSGQLYLGVGLNVNNSVTEPAEGFDAPAVSLREATGHHWSRRRLLFSWLRAFRRCVRGEESECFDPSLLQRHLDTIGRYVQIANRRGKAVGLNNDGGLILSIQGDSKVVYAGDPVEVPYP